MKFSIENVQNVKKRHHIRKQELFHQENMNGFFMIQELNLYEKDGSLFVDF